MGSLSWSPPITNCDFPNPAFSGILWELTHSIFWTRARNGSPAYNQAVGLRLWCGAFASAAFWPKSFFALLARSEVAARKCPVYTVRAVVGRFPGEPPMAFFGIQSLWHISPTLLYPEYLCYTYSSKTFQPNFWCCKQYAAKSKIFQKISRFGKCLITKGAQWLLNDWLRSPSMACRGNCLYSED